MTFERPSVDLNGSRLELEKVDLKVSLLDQGDLNVEREECDEGSSVLYDAS